MSSPDSSTPSLRDRVLNSAMWLIATRWVHRALGLVSTMILARLLMPEDFGLVAAVTATVAIIDGFFDFGFDLALIQKKDAGRAEFDAAWTLKVCKGALFGLTIALLGPLVAHYAGAEEIVAISLVVGFALLLRGAENVGTVRFQKELQFDKLFRIKLYPRLLAITTTIVAALWLRSYWAIVIGTLAQNAYQTLFSYLMCDYRPRLRLRGIGELWGFSRWILLSSICRQAFRATDRFLLSGWIGKRELGFFSVSGDLSSMITNELVGAVGTALVPGYAKLQDDQARLRAAFLMSQSAYLALLIPASIGILLLAPQLTAVILGAQWTEASHLLGLFALFYMFYTVAENLNRFMAMTGLQEVAGRAGLLRTIAFLILIYPAFQWGGIPGLIAMKISLSAIETLYMAARCCQRIDAPLGDYLGLYLRPGVATAAMAAALALLEPLLAGHVLLGLLVGALAGAAVYGMASLLMWRFSGRPKGLETVFFELLARRGLKFRF